MVPYSDLIERVWDNSDVTFHTVIQTANDLKRALGEYGDCVQNITGKGYRFRRPLAPHPRDANAAGLDLETLTRHSLGIDEFRLRTESSMRRALGHFRYVTEKYPCFVDALVGKADCLTVLGHAGYQVFAPADVIEEAYESAKRAAEFASNKRERAASLAALAKIKLIFEWDVIGAEAQYRTALTFDQDCAAAFHGIAHVLLFSRRWKESLDVIGKARLLTPSSPMVHGTAGWLKYFMHRFDEAIVDGEKTIELHDRFFPGYLMLGASYQAVGEHSKAIRAFETAYALEPAPAALSFLGHAFAATGKESKAESCLRRLESLGKERFVSSWCNSLVQAGLGNNETAILLLRTAADERCDWLLHLEMDPRWDSLRGLPEFNALVARVKRTNPIGEAGLGSQDDHRNPSVRGTSHGS